MQIDDFQWACKPDESGPDFFLYDLSWAGFARGDVKVEDIQQETGIEVSTLEDLREALAAIFQRYAPCAIAVKAQHAYTAPCAGRSALTTRPRVRSMSFWRRRGRGGNEAGPR